MDSIALVLLLFLMAALFFISTRISIYMTKRAICKVVNIFRTNDAVDPSSAMPLGTMGLSDRPRLFSFGLRDYKPYAIQALVQAQVIQTTVDGRYYLSGREEKEFEQKTSLACNIEGIPRGKTVA